jgi:hypothetical protein
MSLTQIKDFFIMERSLKNASTQPANDPFPHLEGRSERAWHQLFYKEAGPSKRYRPSSGVKQTTGPVHLDDL